MKWMATGWDTAHQESHAITPAIAGRRAIHICHGLSVYLAELRRRALPADGLATCQMFAPVHYLANSTSASVPNRAHGLSVCGDCKAAVYAGIALRTDADYGDHCSSAPPIGFGEWIGWLFLTCFLHVLGALGLAWAIARHEGRKEGLRNLFNQVRSTKERGGRTRATNGTHHLLYHT
jgi:hypothetical protein